MTPMQVPCSQSAHDENVLARRPQSDAHDENVLAWDKSASRRARGWAGENVARSKGLPGHTLCKYKRKSRRPADRPVGVTLFSSTAPVLACGGGE